MSMLVNISIMLFFASMMLLMVMHIVRQSFATQPSKPPTETAQYFAQQAEQARLKAELMAELMAGFINKPNGNDNDNDNGNGNDNDNDKYTSEKTIP
jgi:hypothetical protein